MVHYAPIDLAVSGRVAVAASLASSFHRGAGASQLVQRRFEASEHRGHGTGSAWIRGKPVEGGSRLHEIAAAVVELVVRRPP